jgi:IS30 family transposase
MEDSKGQLCLAERRVIWKGRRLGYSVSKIAKEVGRSKSTISRELRRNANSGADWIDLSAMRLVNIATKKSHSIRRIEK